MRVFNALPLILVYTLFSGLLAMALPDYAAVQLSRELDGILRAAGIELPKLHSAFVQESARELVASAERARIAIAQHVLDTRAGKSASTAIRASKLQAALMQRIESHLDTQLDNLGRVDLIEWELHRGFSEGLSETLGRSFLARNLPKRNSYAAYRLAMVDEEGGWKERLDSLPNRLNAWLQESWPVAAFRRWRLRRLLAKLSDPRHSSIPIVSESNSPAEGAVRNLIQLRAKLSAIAATKSERTRTAFFETQDRLAADRVDKAPLFPSKQKLKATQKPSTGEQDRSSPQSQLRGWLIKQRPTESQSARW